MGREETGRTGPAVSAAARQRRLMAAALQVPLAAAAVVMAAGQAQCGPPPRAHWRLTRSETSICRVGRVWRQAGDNVPRAILSGDLQ